MKITNVLAGELDAFHPILRAQMKHVARMEMKRGQPNRALKLLRHIP